MLIKWLLYYNVKKTCHNKKTWLYCLMIECDYKNFNFNCINWFVILSKNVLHRYKLIKFNKNDVLMKTMWKIINSIEIFKSTDSINMTKSMSMMKFVDSAVFESNLIESFNFYNFFSWSMVSVDCVIVLEFINSFLNFVALYLASRITLNAYKTKSKSENAIFLSEIWLDVLKRCWLDNMQQLWTSIYLIHWLE